jgi:hypothetical protein
MLEGSQLRLAGFETASGAVQTGPVTRFGKPRNWSYEH